MTKNSQTPDLTITLIDTKIWLVLTADKGPMGRSATVENLGSTFRISPPSHAYNGQPMRKMHSGNAVLADVN